jgi:Putative Actinobacterial Holin-X, holin superfamily III
MMETEANSTESLFECAETYGKTTIELAKLNMLEKTNIVATQLVARFSVLLVAVIFVFTMSIAFALWIGDKLGKAYYGFFVVAGFYLITVLVFHWFLKKWIRKPLSEFIIKQVLE